MLQTRVTQYWDAIFATRIVFGGLVARQAQNGQFYDLPMAEVPILHPHDDVDPTGSRSTHVSLSRLKQVGE